MVPCAARFDPRGGVVAPEIAPLRAARAATLVSDRADAVDERRRAVGRRKRLSTARADGAGRGFRRERLHSRIVPAADRRSSPAKTGRASLHTATIDV